MLHSHVTEHVCICMISTAFLDGGLLAITLLLGMVFEVLAQSDIQKQSSRSVDAFVNALTVSKVSLSGDILFPGMRGTENGLSSKTACNHIFYSRPVVDDSNML